MNVRYLILLLFSFLMYSFDISFVSSDFLTMISPFPLIYTASVKVINQNGVIYSDSKIIPTDQFAEFLESLEKKPARSRRQHGGILNLNGNIIMEYNQDEYLGEWKNMTCRVTDVHVRWFGEIPLGNGEDYPL